VPHISSHVDHCHEEKEQALMGAKDHNTTTKGWKSHPKTHEESRSNAHLGSNLPNNHQIALSTNGIP
jgi:hypothetical protein